jgi:hypothetical protein
MLTKHVILPHCWNPPNVNSRINNNFLMFIPLRESRRIPDPALPKDCSKVLRLHPWRLGSEILRLLQRWGKPKMVIAQPMGAYHTSTPFAFQGIRPDAAGHPNLEIKKSK